MKTLLTVALLLVAQVAGARPQQAYVPPNGVVPDSTTATRIAEAVWTPIYSEERIRNQRPYVAKLQDSIWTVTGSLPRGKVGGVAEIEILKRDGRVLRISHGR